MGDERILKEFIARLETMPFIVAWLFLIFLFVFFATKWVRSIALRQDIMDTPNPRSSHITPTPRGGGLAFVAGISLGHSLLFFYEVNNLWLICLYFSSLVVAGTGWRDDQISLSPTKRLFLQFVATLTLLSAFFPFTTLSVQTVVIPNWACWVLLPLFVMWSINLYNFMDGIDGLSSVQAISVSLGGAMLSYLNGDSLLCFAFIVIASACFGFLRWNWMPASIFSGDVGSTYLGIMFAGLMLAAVSRGTFSLTVGIILMGSFYVDATYTLLVRVIKGQKPHEAHKTHTYQKANRMGHPPNRICKAFALINLFWLVPLAWVASSNAELEIYLFILACLPLVGLSIFYKAGIEESPLKNY